MNNAKHSGRLISVLQHACEEEAAGELGRVLGARRGPEIRELCSLLLQVELWGQQHRELVRDAASQSLLHTY